MKCAVLLVLMFLIVASTVASDTDKTGTGAHKEKNNFTKSFAVERERGKTKA